jgi:hypothetical protein
MKKILRITKKCILCGQNKLTTFLKLGKIPKKNGEKKVTPRKNLPNLNMKVCSNCWHVQAGSVPLPDFYVKDYTYHTRFSETAKKHFKQRTLQINKKFNLKKNDLIIDIGGNDGTFLKNFKNLKKGLKTLCVDPTFKTSNFAKKLGIGVFRDFFGLNTSEQIKKKYGSPKIILCTNTFGAINDMNDFVSGLKNLMDDNTIFIYENPYLIDTLNGLQFDTMYYEHISYFALNPMQKFFKTFNMKIIDYSKSKIHGGSMMVFVQKDTKKMIKKNSIRVLSAINNEKKLGFNKIKIYSKFEFQVMNFKKEVRKLIFKIKKTKKKIACYGASDRGLTLINYLKLDKKHFAFVADRSPFKQGLYFSGTGLKIYDPKILLKKDTKIEYIFLTAWNFKSEIINYFKRNKKKFKFIVPLPVPKIFN